jgi:hypothetical protein
VLIIINLGNPISFELQLKVVRTDWVLAQFWHRSNPSESAVELPDELVEARLVREYRKDIWPTTAGLPLAPIEKPAAV